MKIDLAHNHRFLLQTKHKAAGKTLEQCTFPEGIQGHIQILDTKSDLKSQLGQWALQPINYLMALFLFCYPATCKQEGGTYRIWFVPSATDASLKKFKDVLISLVSVTR